MGKIEVRNYYTNLQQLFEDLTRDSSLGNDVFDLVSYRNTIKRTIDAGYDIRDCNVKEPGPETNPLVIDMEATFVKCLNMVKIKNNDYSGEKAVDPFTNFRKSEAIGVRTEKGILVRMMDKMSRISNLIDQDAQVKSEKIEDTLEDLINYAAILKSYLKQNKK